jgi:hypothetical protein
LESPSSLNYFDKSTYEFNRKKASTKKKAPLTSSLTTAQLVTCENKQIADSRARLLATVMARASEMAMPSSNTSAVSVAAIIVDYAAISNLNTGT